jgi:hypothetical protein
LLVVNLSERSQHSLAGLRQTESLVVAAVGAAALVALPFVLRFMMVILGWLPVLR